MTDAGDLRRLYNSAAAVIAPLKDVHQPSGYSVTLQAMSCGKPVILSNIKGLWDRELLIDCENCLWPGRAMRRPCLTPSRRCRGDAALRERIGGLRASAVKHFGLPRLRMGTLALARRGLSMYAARSKSAA